MTEAEIAKKIKEAAEIMADAIKNGYDVTVRTSKEGSEEALLKRRCLFFAFR